MQNRILDMKCECCEDEPQILYNITDTDGHHRRICYGCLKTHYLTKGVNDGSKKLSAVRSIDVAE
jgi:hypothetical protein